jgi:hypothetical protein
MSLPKSIADIMRRLFGRSAPPSKRPSLPSNKAPAGPVGPPDIPARFLRFDGIAGTERGRSLIPFPPDTVQPGDHLTKGAMFNEAGTEVSCAVLDMGYRHVINGVVRGVLGYMVEADATQGADLTVPPVFTYRHVAPTQARLAPLGVRRYRNLLPIGVLAGAPLPVLNAPFTWWHGSENFPRRHPGANAVGTLQYPAWANPATFSFTPSGANYTRLDLLVALDAAGAPYYIPYANPAANQTLKSVTFYQPNDNMGSNMWARFYPGTTNPWQIVGLVAIYVPTGLAFVLGTTPLDTAGVVVTTQGGTYAPYSFLPDNGPVAMWAPVGSDYNVSTLFSIRPTGTRQNFVDAGHTAAHDTMLAVADGMWRLEGAAGPMDASQYTSYFPTLDMHEFYASTDGARFMMRAVHYSQHFRDHVLGVGPSWTAWQQANEAYADATTHLVDAILTGDHSYLAGPSWMIYGAESGQIVRLTGSTSLRRSGSGRRAMHVNFGLAWFERMQIEASSVVGGHAAYILALSTAGAGHGDQEGWLNADGTSLVDGVNLVTAPTNALRFRRMIEFMENWMAVDTTTPATLGFGTWMQSDIFSCTIKATVIFGERPNEFEMIRDAQEFLYSGVSPINGNVIYFNLAGQERFMYGGGNGTSVSSTPTAVTSPVGTSGVLTNGFHVTVQQWLYEKTGDVKWRDRTRLLVDAMPMAAPQNQAMYYFLKSVGELSSHGLEKPQ